MNTIVIRSGRVVLPDGERPATIHVHDGIITAIGEPDEREPHGARTVDVGSLVVMPGLVDTHVHINEPGRTDWEGFETATRAAAAGGVTTLVDMPLNSVPATTTAEALEEKQVAAIGKCYVDVAFWGGVVPGNCAELASLAQAGVLGFKCFMSASGVEEFAHVDEADLRKAMPILARLGLPLLVHAELPERLLTAAGNPHDYATWLASRPAAAEVAAIDLLIRLAAEYDTRVHIVHLACGDALTAIDEARRRGVPITVETCPHYLTFAAEEIGAGRTAYKCAPPIRAAAHRDALWKALASGRIDLVATDHSPAPPALKGLTSGDFLSAWGGIASLQVGLPVVWTGAHEREIPLAHIARWMSDGPAQLAGLSQWKGRIALGHDADLIVFDPDAIAAVDAQALYHRHPVTPYDGRQLRGRVVSTWLRGHLIFGDGHVNRPPSGRLLKRTRLAA